MAIFCGDTLPVDQVESAPNPALRQQEAAICIPQRPACASIGKLMLIRLS